MNRRDLIKQIALLTGGAVVGAEFFLTGCKAKASAANLSASDIALLNEIAETIIPTTDTPGAKAAKVGEFMKTIVSDCYTDANQNAFVKGITTLQDTFKKANGKSFMEADAKQRHDFLVSLEKEAKAYNEPIEKENTAAAEKVKEANLKIGGGVIPTVPEKPKHYYTMMKQLTLWGYFSSEIGMTKALRHNPVPGRYDGNLPYNKGEKAWS